MLDAKVLAAVLATLTAVATAANGGSVDPSVNLDQPELSSSGLSDSSNIGQLASNPVSFLKDMFTSRPEPTNSLEADLTVEDIQKEDIRLQDGIVRTENLSVIKLGNKKLSSDSAVNFEGFSGRLKFGESIKIKGKTSSIISSGVNISGNIGVDETVNSSVLRVEERGNARISLSSVNGTISSESASTTIGNPRQKLDINSFRGEIRIMKDSRRIVLDGQVDRLEAGSFSFGG